MLETYLGDDRFREGIRRYLDLHRYANTETTDLWDALEQATGEPVRSMMDTWIFQGGHPEVSAELSPDAATLILSQRPFRYRGDGGDARWDVPILLRSNDGPHQSRGRLLLTERERAVPLEAADGWVVVNDGGWGFFRTRYSAALLDRITANLGGLNAIERFNLVSDTWAAAIAGHTPAADFLAMASRLGSETDPSVWGAALGGLDALDRLLDDNSRPGLAAFVRDLVEPAFARVGWQTHEGESERTGTLRATLLRALGTLGADPDVRRRAHELHRAYLADRAAVHPDLIAAVVTIEAWHGDAATYEEFLERYRNAATPQEEVRYLFTLPYFPTAELLTRTLELAITEVRTQNGPFLVSGGLANRRAGPVAWEWLKGHWETTMSRFPHNTHSRMLEGLATLSEPAVSKDVLTFMADHPVPHAKLLGRPDPGAVGAEYRLPPTRAPERLSDRFSGPAGP